MADDINTEAPARESEEDAPGQVPLAVFDLDGTIIRGQSGSLFSRYLFSGRLLGARTMTRLAWWGIRYKLHLPYRQAEARELIFRDLGRLSPERVGQIMRAFYDEVLEPRVRRDARAELERRRREGCDLVLVSATFDAIAEEAAKRLGMDGAAATRMERTSRGRFTGRVLGEVVAGAEKVTATAAWADAHRGAGAWRIAYAYGDHFTDEPLLASARKCFAVCPGKSLRAIARRRGWAILDWS